MTTFLMEEQVYFLISNYTPSNTDVVQVPNHACIPKWVAIPHTSFSQSGAGTNLNMLYRALVKCFHGSAFEDLKKNIAKLAKLWPNGPYLVKMSVF